MIQPRRKFSRPIGNTSYRKLFVISTEGGTETQYFRIFINRNLFIQIKNIKKGTESAPKQVLQRMEAFIIKNELRKTDEAWLVVDKDKWKETDLNMLYEWSKKNPNYGFALSNPKFEYWLLLHFEEGTKGTSSDSCDNLLNKHIPDYKKVIDPNIFTDERIDKAICHAKQRDNPPCADWPKMCGCSTVYKLVEKLRKS